MQKSKYISKTIVSSNSKKISDYLKKTKNISLEKEKK